MGTVWEARGCPFQIEFAAEKLDEIRDAVTRAFYSVPRGGIEIGGVLLGTRLADRLRIHDYRMIDCDHRLGPGFQLSEKELAAAAAVIAGSHVEPLGWFHSHTRSEIFLSAADQEIHDRLFPEAWQVALVVRPGNMRPMRAQYFFRGADGMAGAEEFLFEAQQAAAPVPPIADMARKVMPARPPKPEPAPIQPGVAATEVPRWAQSDAADEPGAGKWVWLAATAALLSIGIAVWVTFGR